VNLNITSAIAILVQLSQRQCGGAAVWLLRLVTRLQPDFAQGWGNLAASLCQERRHPLEAERAARNALRLRPEQEFMAVNLAFALREQGRIDEAVECLLNVSEEQRLDGRLQSSLLLTYLYQYGADPDLVAQAHLDYGKSLEAPYIKFRKPHSNSPDTERVLRVGFVSPDLISHPVANFISKWWQNYNRENFEFVAYHNSLREDNVSARLKTYIDEWHNISNLTDIDLADRIRKDRIDILFDLTGHTANHRLPVFAMKPAPVQVTYLGYPHTTGLESIDWRITDPFLKVPGDEHRYSEKAYQVPFYNCYEPLIGAPDSLNREIYTVKDTPALKNGYITFGCCNNFAKINYKTIKVWSRILTAVPNSKLLIESVGLDNEELRAQTENFSWKTTLSPGVLQLLARVPKTNTFFIMKLTLRSIRFLITAEQQLPIYSGWVFL